MINRPLEFQDISYEIYENEVAPITTSANVFRYIKNKYSNTDVKFSYADWFKLDVSDFEQLLDVLRKKYNDFHCISLGKYIVLEDNLIISIKADSVDHVIRTVTFKLFSSDGQLTKDTIKTLQDELKTITIDQTHRVTFKWFFIERGELVGYELPVELNDIIFPEAYPYIEDFDKYIENYINGSENILILCGQPGTGKTRLIREIIKRMQPVSKLNNDDDDDYPVRTGRTSYRTVTCSNSDEVIHDDKFYFDFLSGYSKVLVLEDADFNLKTTRKDGNSNLNKLLFTADGLIPTNKKIIISTNLNVNHIDSAVVRAGRCYDTLKSRELTRKEVKLFLNKYNNHYNTQYTIEEIMEDDDVINLCDIYKQINNINEQIKDKG